MKSTRKSHKVYKALQEVRCAQDAHLEHQVSTQERRGRRGCRGQRSEAPPRTPDRPTTAANEPRQKRGMALSDDEVQADK